MRSAKVVAFTAAAWLLAASLLTGCQSPTGGGAAEPKSAAPPGKQFTAADVAKLKWIEGTWMGRGTGPTPFFERYHFEGDTRLVVDSFQDETLAVVSDTLRYELRDGQFTNVADGRGHKLSEITDATAVFVPAEGEKNTFRWEKGPNDTWQVVFDWPGEGGKPPQQITYRMGPIPKK